MPRSWVKSFTATTRRSRWLIVVRIECRPQRRDLEKDSRVPDIAFDLRYLRYALRAAEHGSFRRAAEILSVSQSTVSRRIQYWNGVLVWPCLNGMARAPA
ncbi:LysR family transcriptional regulator [Sinorhizobium sp. BJ1]|uniref:LysR family transcriptional regulator n=1 Tax=Sinorhizobium sp. BJ1 TaxID=2035455 RepID=UPI001FE112E5|nr:LysR family transcriptional regulator [Sinorhizobium sp. BJ1]